MKKVLVSAGPIPARLDSVKYITNRFKGGLMAKLASELAGEFDVVFVKWRYAQIHVDGVSVLTADDVLDYKQKVLETQADAYILGAAVANLMPTNPWPGKFPSHQYSEGEEIQIGFKISPRIIDRIKEKNPRSTLIGYKLFDGSQESLIAAARKTLVESKANVIFANRPDTPYLEKFMLTQDFAVIRMSFDEHVQRIKQLLDTTFYTTKIVSCEVGLTKELEHLANMYPRTEIDGRVFGTFAMRDPKGGFFTTSRGKIGRKIVRVICVDHEKHIVYASEKATLNAPLLDKVFQCFNGRQVILHDHQLLPGVPELDYQFPGTALEANMLEGRKVDTFNIRGHGYIQAFDNFTDAVNWIG